MHLYKLTREGTHVVHLDVLQQHARAQELTSENSMDELRLLHLYQRSPG